MSKAINNFDEGVLEILKGLEISDNLIHFARTNIERNDVAHYFDHVDAVIRQSQSLATIAFAESDKYKDPSVKRIVAIAALMHDTACWVNRADHHKIAAEWMMNNLDSEESLKFYGLIPAEVPIIATCILEHRASWDKDRSSIYSEIVAAADRGKLEITECLRRSYLYGRFAKGLDVKAATTHACDHIADKYGENGYVYNKLPKLCLMATEDINLLRTQAMDKKLGNSIITDHREGWEKYYQEVKYARE